MRFQLNMCPGNTPLPWERERERQSERVRARERARERETEDFASKLEREHAGERDKGFHVQNSLIRHSLQGSVATDYRPN